MRMEVWPAFVTHLQFFPSRPILCKEKLEPFKGKRDAGAQHLCCRTVGTDNSIMMLVQRYPLTLRAAIKSLQLARMF